MLPNTDVCVPEFVPRRSATDGANAVKETMTRRRVGGRCVSRPIEDGEPQIHCQSVTALEDHRRDRESHRDRHSHSEYPRLRNFRIQSVVFG